MPIREKKGCVYQHTTFATDSAGSDPATYTVQGRGAKAHWANTGRRDWLAELADRLAKQEIDPAVRAWRTKRGERQK